MQGSGLARFRPIYTESKTLIEGERDSESDEPGTVLTGGGMVTRQRGKLKKHD